MTPQFAIVDNYIYLYHTDTYAILPVYPETVNDINQANFSTSTPLSRSAPIYSFTSSGPRQVSFTFVLHRDLMDEVNQGVSTLNLDEGKDYLDSLINQMQACAVPNYNAVAKMVDPPMVAVRLGDEIFIKGVVLGGPQIAYSGPLVNNKNNPSGSPKYSIVTISLTISEIDPYTAETVIQMGSFRGLTPYLENRLMDRKNVRY